MVSVRQFAWLLALGLTVFRFSGPSEILADTVSSSERSPAHSFYAQSVSRLLLREFDNPDISFLLLDAKNGSVVASRWGDPENPISLGSLVKPFTALAYGEEHDFKYPMHICKGNATGCWRPQGHGAIDITGAIANSCNSYFRMLTAGMIANDLRATAQEFGVDEPSNTLHDAALSGLGGEWKVAPLHMARAYLELSKRRHEPGVAEILAGMAQSAEKGTGQKVGAVISPKKALVKTGTAPCVHRPRAPGDGFVVVLFPAEEPDFVLLVRMHGIPGAKAATTAGEIVRRIEE